MTCVHWSTSDQQDDKKDHENSSKTATDVGAAVVKTTAAKQEEEKNDKDDQVHEEFSLRKELWRGGFMVFFRWMAIASESTYGQALPRPDRPCGRNCIYFDL